MAAHAYKTKWYFLILEDEPSARELLKANFTSLLGDACQFDFAASLCQAVHKVKAQMQIGLPHDVFWVDLVLDYFSCENARGEIVSAKSLSEIIDTERLRRQLNLANLSSYSLAAALGLQVLPINKNLKSYSTAEKIQLLEKSIPFCLPEAQACFQTLVELLQYYLQAERGYFNGAGAENVYARQALDFVFRQFSNWVESQEKEFSLREEDLQKLYAPEIDEMSLHDAGKSAQTWTVFRDWVRDFYDSVARNDRAHQNYALANPLLIELKRIAPRDYPLFLVNSFYAGEREKMLDTGAVYDHGDTIVAGQEFKGTTKDALLANYLAQICSRLRIPYLELRHKRRGAARFVLTGKYLEEGYLRRKKRNANEIILKSEDYRLAFTAKSFFPDFSESLYQVHGATPQFIESANDQAWDNLRANVQRRAPAEIKRIAFWAPATFFTENRPIGKFLLHVKTEHAEEIRKDLSFDEGRWLFLELCCRKWFPKVFFVHSSWMPQPLIDSREYFVSTDKWLANVVKHAAVDNPTLFPSAVEITKRRHQLPETAGFYGVDTDYASAFEWPVFVDNLFASSDLSGKKDLVSQQALGLLAICRELVIELKLRKVANLLFKQKALTPHTLIAALEDPLYEPALETLQSMARTIENASPQIIMNDYLPGIKNFIAVILCFYALPAKPIEQFYRFWRQKGIPDHHTRPTEKFSTISEKLEGVVLKKSLDLPAVAEGKNNFLYVPAALTPGGMEIITTDHAGSAVRLSDMNHEEFIEFIGKPE